MGTPEQTEPIPGPASESMNELLASPGLAKAVENDEFKRFLDFVPIAIAVSKHSGGEQRIVYVNRVFESLAGKSFADMDDKTWSVLDPFTLEDDAQVPLGRAVLAGEDFIGVFRREREGGKPVLVQAYAGVIENDDGTENYRLAALVDVSDRERSQREEFERQIRDKDMLLLELQHRVKNNLQLIIALIRFESRHARSGEAINLDRLAGRIEALQILYQAISTEAFTEEVDLGPYLGEIASAAVRAHAPEGVELALKVGYAPVSINVALPAGLAVNELLTNALKYAFPGGRRGTITLECLRDEDNQYAIVVSDDGIGLPLGVTWPTPGKLGALVMQTLRENAKASLRVDSTPGKGTRTTIGFAHSAAPRKTN
jgi:PAS domain S-box-containing protein